MDNIIIEIVNENRGIYGFDKYDRGKKIVNGGSTLQVYT